MIDRTINFLLYSIFAPLVLWTMDFNPNWLQDIPEKEKSILDRWNGVQSVPAKVILLYLASPFLLFYRNGFRIYLDRKTVFQTYFNVIIGGLLVLLSAICLVAFYYNHGNDAGSYLMSFGVVFLLGAVGTFIANADVLAALYLRRIMNK